MKLIIAGSRTITDYKILDFCMSHFDLHNKAEEIVSGGAKGVDKLGEWYAISHDIPMNVFKPDWSAGRGAGMVRNKEMLEYADTVLLIWNGQSKGSKFMKDNAEKFGCKLYEYIVLI